MFDFLLTSILWILALYGLFDIIKTLFNIYTYSNFKEDGIYIIVGVKNQEDSIEGFLRSKSFACDDSVKEIIVTDLDSNDKTLEIVEKLSNECSKIRLVSWEECKKILDNIISS